MSRSPTAAIAIVLTLFLTVGASAKPRPDDGGERPAFKRPPLFISPAGMPFRSDAEGDQSPFFQWFTQADTDGDGSITRAELQQDFEAAFAEYDSDGNGTLDAFEVRHYEQKIFPEIATSGLAPRGGNAARNGAKRGSGGKDRGRGGQSGKRGGGEAKGSRGGGSQSYNPNAGGAARFGLLPIYHPLLDADKDINWRVSADEFNAVVNERFDFLDDAKTGILTLEQLRGKFPRRRGKPKR